MGDHVELDVPARPEFLALVRSIVTLIAETGSKLPAPRIEDLRLAVTEACANAIDAERRVQVSGDVVELGRGSVNL